MSRQPISEAASLTILMVGIAAVGIQALMLSPLLPDIAAALQASPREIGFATGAYGAGVALAALLAAPKLGQWQKARAIRTAFMVMGAGLALCGLAWDWRLLVVGQAVTGLAAGIILPATYGLAAELASPDRRSRAIGKVILGWSVAMVGGIPLAAFLSDLIDWRSTFALMTAICTAMVLLIGIVPRGSGTIAADRISYARVFELPGMKLCFLATFAYMIAFYQTYTFVGDHVRHLHHAGAWLGGALACSYGVGFGAAVLGNAWLDRMGPVRLMALSLFLVGINYLILPYAVLTLWSTLAFPFVWGLANHICMNVLVSFIGSAPASARSTAMGLFSFITYVAVGLGGAVFGSVYTHAGFAAVSFAATAMLWCAALAVALFLRRQVAPAQMPSTTMN
ncbi:MFS transporter [Dongia sp.]|uniref:MFS transporter n=1 Tax=Dongia sp. TaxID=1977262 RepID=UPI0035AE2D0A